MCARRCYLFGAILRTAARRDEERRKEEEEEEVEEGSERARSTDRHDRQKFVFRTGERGEKGREEPRIIFFFRYMGGWQGVGARFTVCMPSTFVGARLLRSVKIVRRLIFVQHEHIGQWIIVSDHYCILRVHRDIQ